MRNKKIREIIEKSDVKMTPLREDVLSIILSSKQPVGAYEILDKLRKKRPTAEPPTVYRVLDFLKQKHIIHRIDATNTYLPCSKHCPEEDGHNTVLVICKNCKKGFEYEDPSLQNSFEKFSKKHHIQIDQELIVISGLCESCN